MINSAGEDPSNTTNATLRTVLRTVSSNSEVGLGAEEFSLAVYLANTPPMSEYQQLDKLQPVITGELHAIGQACGNGWRKVFNVYAKLLYALDSNSFGFSQQAETWQAYRDSKLLQASSHTALLFSPPVFAADSNVIHIICGRTYAKQLITDGLVVDLVWLDEEFAIDKARRLIVCPYFDYRQLSNIKITRLAAMLHEMKLSQV